MCSKNHDNKIKESLDICLQNLKHIIDANTVIGTPLTTTHGELIIPISKVTVGLILGAGEYGKISIFKSGEDMPFTAGNGAIISAKPNGLLIRDRSGEFKLLSCNNSPYEKLIDKASEIINDIKEEKSCGK